MPTYGGTRHPPNRPNELYCAADWLLPQASDKLGLLGLNYLNTSLAVDNEEQRNRQLLSVYLAQAGYMPITTGGT